MVAERLVAFAHGLLEASGGGAFLECVALTRVAREAVEHGAECLRSKEPVRGDALIDEKLVHDELIDGHPGNAPEKRLESFVQSLAWCRFDGETPLDRLGSREAV